MAEQKSPTGKQAVLGVAVGMAIAAVLYAGAWIFTAHQLRGGVERWLDARRAEGFSIRTGSVSTTGFPSRVAVRIADVDLSAPPARGRWTWRTPLVDINVSPLNLDRIAIDLSGAHSFSSPWFKAPLLKVSATKAAVLLTFRDRRLDEAQITVDGGESEWNTGDSRLHVDKAGVLVSLASDTSPLSSTSSPSGGATPAVSSRLAVKIENLVVPGALPPPLGNTLGELAFNAEVIGPVTDGSLPAILDAWSKAGGAVNLKDVSLDWAPLAITGEGSLALDGDLQPTGAFTARLRGFSEGLDMMVRVERMGKDEAAVAKAMLGLMSKPGPDGRAEISLPLTVQDRMLSSGPLKLFELPRVDWPRGTPP